jgi:hypothetical protein
MAKQLGGRVMEWVVAAGLYEPPLPAFEDNKLVEFQWSRMLHADNDVEKMQKHPGKILSRMLFRL